MVAQTRLYLDDSDKNYKYDKNLKEKKVAKLGALMQVNYVCKGLYHYENKNIQK